MRHTMLFVIAALGLNGSAAWANHNQEAASVQSWYQQYLHRDADLYGLSGWVSVLRHQGPVAVQAGILGSDEYYHSQGCSPEGVVAGLYADVLGRAANALEIHGWVCSFASHGCRVRLAQDFLCAAQTELALRAMPAPPINYQPAPAYSPLPAVHGGYGYSQYQVPSPYRTYR